MGWLTGWGKRKSHIINQQAGAGIDYQMKVIVHSGAGVDAGNAVYLNGGCTNFPNDITFTGADGTTLLDHWCEDLTADPAIFWVEVADDLDTANRTIYIYYEKAGQSSSIDGDATFRFYDHFLGDSLDLDKWDIIGGAPTVAGSIVTLIGDWMRTDNVFARPWRLRCKSRIRHLTTNSFFCVGDNGVLDYAVAMRHPAVPIWRFQCRDPTGWQAPALIGGALTVDQWYVWEQHWWNNVYVKLFRDGVLDATALVRVPDNPMSVAFRSSTSNPTVEADWVFVAKFVDPEPVHGDWGAEEEAPVTIGDSIVPLMQMLEII